MYGLEKFKSRTPYIFNYFILYTYLQFGELVNPDRRRRWVLVCHGAIYQRLKRRRHSCSGKGGLVVGGGYTYLDHLSWSPFSPSRIFFSPPLLLFWSLKSCTNRINVVNVISLFSFQKVPIAFVYCVLCGVIVAFSPPSPPDIFQINFLLDRFSEQQGRKFWRASVSIPQKLHHIHIPPSPPERWMGNRLMCVSAFRSRNPGKKLQSSRSVGRIRPSKV